MRRDAYERACQHVMDGGELPGPIAGEIEHDAQPKPQGIPETREARIARLQQVLGKDFNERAATRKVRV
jgi:hypothetical protein